MLRCWFLAYFLSGLLLMQTQVVHIDGAAGHDHLTHQANGGHADDASSVLVPHPEVTLGHHHGGPRGFSRAATRADDSASASRPVELATMDDELPIQAIDIPCCQASGVCSAILIAVPGVRVATVEVAACIGAKIKTLLSQKFKPIVPPPQISA